MEQKEKKLKIYFTSDIHGYFYPTNYGDYLEKKMGLFQCAGDFIKDNETLVIDGGDILQGSAFAYYCKQILQSPITIAEIMNDCGYDYFTLGNHDFNYGQKYQSAYIQKNKGRCVCQNVCDNEGKILFPYDIRIMPNGIKVGIVGAVTDYVKVWEKKENLVGIQISDPFIAAKEALFAMKDSVDITICVYHGGFERDLDTGKLLSNTTENVGYRICEELDYDILLTGHQHMSIEGRMLGGTYIVQPAENAKEYQYLEVSLKDGQKSIHSEKRSADMDKGEFLRQKYREMEDKIQDWLNQPIGRLSVELQPEEKVVMALNGSPIADFLNRVQLHFSGAQISSVGLANEITGFHKEVSTRDIIATYPYPNTLVVCKISGKQLKEAMERSAEYFTVETDGTVAVADSFLKPKLEHYNYDYYMGVEYEIRPENPIGERITKLVFQGKNVKEEDTFTLCLNNYRFSGAGGYQVYNECELIKEINIEMVEMIMEYFQTRANIR